MKISFAEFREICEVDDPENWVPWLSVCPDGVYIKMSFIKSGHFTRSECLVLTEHPTKNLLEPVLAFPCSEADFLKFLIEQEMDDDDIKQNLNDLMMQNTEQAEEENTDVLDVAIQQYDLPKLNREAQNQQRRQAIINALDSLGFSPKNLPPSEAQSGHAGLRSRVWELVQNNLYDYEDQDRKTQMFLDADTFFRFWRNAFDKNKGFLKRVATEN